jgi:hypothetical protein
MRAGFGSVSQRKEPEDPVQYQNVTDDGSGIQY